MKSEFVKKSIAVLVLCSMFLADVAPCFAAGSETEGAEICGTEEMNCDCNSDSGCGCGHEEENQLSGDTLFEEDAFSNVTISEELAAEASETIDKITEMMEAGQIVYDEDRGVLVLTDPDADLSGLPIDDIQAVGPDGAGADGETGFGGELLSGAEPAENLELYEKTTSESAVLCEDMVTSEGAVLCEELSGEEAAELSWLWDKHHYETKASYVTVYNTYKGGRYVTGSISGKGTVVTYVSSAWSGIVLFSDKYYQIRYSTSSGTRTGWVMAKNIAEAVCQGTESCTVCVTGKTSQVHTYYNKYAAVYCSKCGQLLQSASNSLSWFGFHEWNNEGKCKVCGYTYAYSVKTINKELYRVKEKAGVRTKPYASGTSVRTLPVNEIIKVTGQTQNANGELWYRIADYEWVKGSSVEKHSHTFSHETGLCTVCGQACDSYEIEAISPTEYERNKTGVSLRKRPHDSAPEVRSLSAKEVVYVNGSAMNAPWGMGGFLGIGRSYGDKWFRTVDGYWVKSTDVNKHTKHDFSATSEGKCTYTGCTYKEPINEQWISTTCPTQVRETKTVNVALRTGPYDTSTVVKTLPGIGHVVSVSKQFKNCLKQVWYKTTEGYWVKASLLTDHTHRLHAGTCFSAGCNYQADVSVRKITPSFVETTVSAAFKTKPFDDAGTSFTAEKGYCFTIVGAATVQNDSRTWLQCSNGTYVLSGGVKAHKHQYSEGYCDVCGSFAPFSKSDIAAKIVKTNSDGVSLRQNPYNSANLKKTISAKGTELVIIGKASNYYKQTWFEVQGGGWVSSALVAEKNGSSVSYSTKAKLDAYELRFVDTNNKPVSGVKVTWVNENYYSDSQGRVSLAYITEKRALSIARDNYDPVYIDSYEMKSNHKDTISLCVAGSCEPSKVTMTYAEGTTDILKKAVTLNKFHTQKIFSDQTISISCAMSASTPVKKYELVQGNTVVQTSTDGNFSGLTVKDFTEKKSVQLKVYDGSNKLRSTIPLLLNIYNEGAGFNESVIAKLGFLSIDITLPDINPLVGGIQIKLDPSAALKVNYEVDDESSKVTLNVDPEKFSKSVNAKDGKTEWTSISAYKKYYNTMKENGRNWSKWESYNKSKIEEDKNKPKDKWSWSISGYIEKLHGENTHIGSLSVTVSYKPLAKEKQLTLGPVPVVLGISFKAEATVGGKLTVTNAEVVSITMPLDISVKLDVSAGVGLAYVASISIYGTATLKIGFQLIPWDFSKANISLSGTVGLRAKALGMEILNWPFLNSPVIDILKKGEWVLWEYEDLYEYMGDDDNWQPIDRSYLKHRSAWYEEDKAELSEDEPAIFTANFDYDVLQSDAYTDIKPKVVTADGTIMMIYADDNENRAAEDRTMLVYSCYDLNGKKWSEPQPVHDDGTGDYGFSVTSINDDIYVVWQNAKSLNEGITSISAIAANTEVTVAKYNKTTDCFEHIERITSNSTYEIMPRIASVDGETVVTWFTNSEGDIFNGSGFDTLYYAVKADADYAPAENYTAEPEEDDQLATGDLESEVLPDDTNTKEFYTEPEEVPWQVNSMTPISEKITSLAVGYLLDGSYIAYTTDEDGSQLTQDDQYVWLVDPSTGEITQFTDHASNVEFTRVHGRDAMTWYNQGMIYYAYINDEEIAPQQLYNEDTYLGEEYQIISDDSGNMAVLYTVNGDESSDAYMLLYDNENLEWGYPIRISEQENYIRDFKGAYSDGVIIGVFNWIEVSGTDFVEDNTLCTITVGERHDLSLSDISFDPFSLNPGEDLPAAFTVRNNGTHRIESFTVTVKDADGAVVDTETFTDVIKSGESLNVEMGICMPSEITKQTLYVSVSEDDETEDIYPVDNETSFEIGAADLSISASYEPEGDDNIVVLTVTNRGYEPMGGTLGFIGEDDKLNDIILEKMEAIEHNEEYSCAVLLNDASFGTEKTKTFRFGVAAEGESDAVFSTSIVVTRTGGMESADIVLDEIPLGGETESVFSEFSGAGGFLLTEEPEAADPIVISGTVRNQTLEDVDEALLWVTIYDGRGILQDIWQRTISIKAEEEYAFAAEFSGGVSISSVRISLVNGLTLEPLCDVTDTYIERSTQ